MLDQGKLHYSRKRHLYDDFYTSIDEISVQLITYSFNSLENIAERARRDSL